MRWYDDFIRNAPRNLNGFFAVLTVPASTPFPEALQGKRACGVVWCYTGPREGTDSAEAGYLNFNQEFGEDPIRKNYGSNYDRLRKIKAKYDPENFFHMNHNIEPET